ncbi:MAG: chromate resistance protein ChrB domain-containing protein [Vicinamibacterales bacterium]
MTASDPQHRTEVRASAPPHRWLLLVHQLPAEPSNLRVKTWRRLQQVGALAVKQAVYALPDAPGTREDFEWLKTEIEGVGGEATIFIADTVDTWTNDSLVEGFRRAREIAYTELAKEAEQVLRRLEKRKAPSGRSAAPRVQRQIRERLAAIERVDFFGSAGRDRVVTLVHRIENQIVGRRGSGMGTGAGESPSSYDGRLWVTRPRPGVDRMSSAWLIRRFIDAKARFDFVADREDVPANALPFDMFGVEFTHRGELCTFEMLCETFNLAHPALASIGAIVHDLDLKDGRFGAAEAPAVGLVIDGLRLAFADDEELLGEGMTLFEALYRSFSHSNRSTGPRRVAKRPARRAEGSKTRSKSR